MKKKETLYIYTRISSRSQEDGSSLETQKELGIKKSKELGMDYEVRDEGTQSSSHDDLDNRPVLETLLIDVEDGLVKHLFAYNNDRLSRNKQTQHLINFRLEEKGVVLYTKDGVFDLTNPHDDLLKTFLDGISRYDNVLRTERSRIGKVHKTREQNTWLGGPAPYGYQIVDKKLCLHPEESKWVKKMYGWYYDGKSTMWIKSQLDTNGVLARRGGLFAIGSIDKLLQNTHHKGLYEWTDKKSGETIHQTCPAIVDETIWNECQERRKKVFARKSQNNATKKFYLLRNLLVCEECGSNISARTREKRDERFYYCPCKMKNWKKGALSKDKKWKRGKVGEHGCTMVRSLNIPITDKFVWDTVIDTVSNSSILKEGFKGEVLKSKFKGDKENERLLRNQKTKSKRLMKQLKLVQSSIAEVETKNLLNEYDDAEIYAGIKSNLVAELKKVKDDIEQTRIAIKELGNQNKWLDWIEKYGDDLRLKNDLSKEDKKDYLEGLIEKIGVRLDKETNDHHLTINFQMGLVGDRIEYVDQGHKSDGYEVIEGDKGEDMVISYEQVQKTHKDRRISGRYPKKKQWGHYCIVFPPTPTTPSPSNKRPVQPHAASVFAVTTRHYPPELFSDDNPEHAFEVAEKVKFASIQAEDGTLCDAVFAPFVVVQRSGKTVLEGHLVRTNPLYELIMQGPLLCRLVFQAADGYVSPSIYAEKLNSGKVVPTWNYVAAQFFGTLKKVPDQNLLALLSHQVDQFEHSHGSDWRLSDAPSDYIEQLSQAVFGICFEPARARTHHKLSQNRPTDKTAVIAWTQTLDTPYKTLAYWMSDPDEQ